MKEKTRKRIIKWWWIVVCSCIAAVLLLVVGTGLFAEIPSFEELENPESKEATLLLADGGEVLSTYHIENRSYVDYDELSPYLVEAAVATEDVRFYKHSGIDFRSLARVGVKTLLLGQSSQGGGSTITQQLAKNMYFTQEKSFIRKIAEMFMAFRLESSYTKDEILELYVNSIYFGDGYYCVRDASQGYFGKDPIDMTDYESTLLAGIPNAPSVYSLTANPDLAEQRQQYVIQQMVKYGYISEGEGKKLSQ